MRWHVHAAIAAALLVGACADEGRPCYPGDYQACACGDDRGYARCDADGEAYGACDCSGTIPGLGGGAGGGDAGGGGASGGGGAGGSAKLPFMAPCSGDDECETGLCYDFAAKGPHCSKTCTLDTDCPLPSPGCNLMGICKAP